MDQATSPRWMPPQLHEALDSAATGERYLATGIALGIWSLWPVMHEDPFAVFIAAVIVVARFFGFGPALLCTTSSGAVACLLCIPSSRLPNHPQRCGTPAGLWRWFPF